MVTFRVYGSVYRQGLLNSSSRQRRLVCSAISIESSSDRTNQTDKCAGDGTWNLRTQPFEAAALVVVMLGSSVLAVLVAYKAQ